MSTTEDGVTEIVDDGGHWIPHCPACSKPLDGDLVATKCNHVFHRACVPDDGSPCPKCQKSCDAKGNLDLFGLGFGANTERKPKVKLSPGAQAKAAEVCELQRQVEQQRREAEALKLRLQEAQAVTEKQKAKMKAAEKQRNQLKESCDKAKHLREMEKAKRESLLQKVNRSREDSAAVEYYHKKLKGDADAQDFLASMVDFMCDPAPLLAEVARLRDHHREQVSKQQKEHVSISQKESRIRHEITEKKRAIAEMQRKIQKCDAKFRQGTDQNRPEKSARIL